MAKQATRTNHDQPGREVNEGNDVGIDPHKTTLTAAVLDRRGGWWRPRRSRSPASGTGRWRSGRAASAPCAGGASRGPAPSDATPRCS